ncbi:MAG: sigma-70 family RNA polymerase sigma factor [Candidatus Nomurabacteria bacterium]|nr:sigma-70 family RNA polymerase sigma factor [Candidatus Nomurabacteria bacterium]
MQKNKKRSAKDLIIAYQENNDSGALNELFKIYEKKIKLTISCYVTSKRSHIVDDIYQDTVINIIKAFNNGAYKERGQFLSWARRASINVSINHLRKGQRTNKYVSLFSGVDLSIYEFLPGSQRSICKWEESDFYLKVKFILENKLPYEQRVIVILRYFAGMKFKDIAEITGVSRNTSLGRIRYALRKFCKHLGIPDVTKKKSQKKKLEIKKYL